MSRGTKIIVGMLLILGGIGVGIWSVMDMEATLDHVMSLESFDMVSNETQVLSLEGDTTYIIEQKRVQPLDRCEVLAPDGGPLTLKTLKLSTDQTYQDVYSFTTGDTGSYQVTCTAKTGGRYVYVRADTNTDVGMGVLIGCSVVFMIGMIILIRALKSKSTPPPAYPAQPPAAYPVQPPVAYPPQAPTAYPAQPPYYEPGQAPYPGQPSGPGGYSPR